MSSFFRCLFLRCSASMWRFLCFFCVLVFASFGVSSVFQCSCFRCLFSRFLLCFGVSMGLSLVFRFRCDGSSVSVIVFVVFVSFGVFGVEELQRV